MVTSIADRPRSGVFLYRRTASHIMRRNRRLYKAALRHFKTWNGALEAAGINPDGLDRQRAQADYDKRAVIEFLQDRQQAGLPVAWGWIWLEYQLLAVVAKRLFGNWRNTLIAAGIPPERHGSRKPGLKDA